MAPLVALVVGFGVARLAGFAGLSMLDGWQPALRVGLATLFVLTGVAHFVGKRAMMIAIVPPRLPRPALLVTITGVLELAGAIGLLVPATSHAAAACLAVLLILMFPANVYAARTGAMPGRLSRIGPRTALQLLFLAACLSAAL